ncbi:MAG: single-stranded DNA-binding protein [Syntrophales bacterium]|jgi:single-strand DNA-binding protein|nr:single-stranded DNA-binding protein [Syntrophales bacterium]
MLNKVQFIGRLGADPEVRYTPDGAQVTSFQVASDYIRKDKSGNKIKETEWLSCVCWNKLAEIAGQYLVKGRLVFVEGRLRTRSWEDKEGVKRYKTEAILSEMKLLEKKQQSDDDPGAQHPGMTAFPDDSIPDDDVPF